MRTQLVKILAIGLLLSGTGWAYSQEDAKAIVEKALKAHGGAEKLNKIKLQTSKA